MPMDEQQQRLHAMAKAISTAAKSKGFICLVRDTEGRAHLIPGHDCELIGVYDERIRKRDILEDLIDAQVER